MSNTRRIIEVDTKVLDAVDRHWREHRIPPTIRWVSQQAGVASLSHVASIYDKLAEYGYLSLVHGKPVPAWVSQALEEAPDVAN